MKAWIKPPSGKLIFLHQNNLRDGVEASTLADGHPVFFDTKVKKGEKGERLDATNCALAQPAPLLEFLLGIGNSAIEFVCTHAAPAVLAALRREFDQLDTGLLEPHQLTNLTDLKNQLARPLSTKPKPSRSEPPSKAVVGQPIPQPVSAAGAGRFLHSIFASNSAEYNLQLFGLLTEGIKSIDNEDAFTQACFLLEFNNQLIEGHQISLPARFYELASPAYRFRFWLQGVVSYCDPVVLLTEYAKGNDALRTSILNRCPVDSLGLLNGREANQLTAKVEAHFRHIKASILTELDSALTVIQVAVAWFTHDELFGLLCAKLAQGVRVELIINNDYINNWEFGLPFQEFIDQGGLLYLSESPSMMHHKFCLIDEAVLLTGSYNWTYYAELRNEENLLLIKEDADCINSFKAEFVRLRDQLGEPVQTITPFQAAEITRFERLGFREYLSKDIESRVTYTKKHKPKADIQTLARWLDKAVEIDELNTTARKLQHDLAPKVTLEKGVIQAQRTVEEVLATVPTSNNAASTPVPYPPVADQAPAVNNVAPTSPPVPATAPATVQPPTATSTSKPVSPALPAAAPRSTVSNQPARPISPVASSNSNTVGTASATPTRPVATPTVVDTGLSIPESQSKAPLFPNLQLVFALDYSNSMEANGGQGTGGYMLYSTGKVQKVIDMIYAICKGLTPSGKIDMFLFEKNAKQLAPVTESNYRTYVQEEVLNKHKMDGTNIFAPIEAIHTKYTNGKEAKSNVFVILITDGENNQPADNERIKKYFGEHSSLPIFWQFVGLGAKFAFLEDVAKSASNTAFFNLNDVQTVAETKLADRLLQKFPTWFEQAKQHGIVQ